jgi:virginiamycin B lyase
VLEILESRQLLSAGGDPLGVATGAGPDTNIWFTLSSNAIGMINPANPGGGITPFAIPTPNSAPGPIAAGPQAILYASDIDTGQIYKVDKTNGTLLQTIPVSKGLDSLIFDNNNNIIYTAWSAGGVGQVRRVDLNVGISSDTLLATIGNGGHDITLMPGGNSVLATSNDTGKIYEVSLTNPGQTPATFGSGQYKNGVVYDSQGRLFAVSKGTAVVELDPQTFNVIASTGPMKGLDGLAFDSSTGNLFVSSMAVDAASGRKGIYEVSLQQSTFLQDSLITSSAFPSAFSPDGLETDGEGNLYLASRGDYKIYRYDVATGQLTALTSPLPGLDDLVPLSGTGGHSPSDYWFFEEAAGQFGAINPTTGHITEFPLHTSGNPQVDGITAGPGGTVWFTEYNTNRIGMIDTDTDKITEFPLNTPNAHPYGIVEGPDGTIWFTEAGANQIGRINPTTDVIQEFTIDPSGNDQAEGITIGPDSNLWFVLTGTDKIGAMNPTTGAMIGEYSVPTSDAGLSQIVSDRADGNVWFTETAADKVGRFNLPTQAFAEFGVPTAGAAPQAITIAKDGTIWFAESSAGRLAQFSPKDPGFITEFKVSNPPGGGTPTPTPTPSPTPTTTPTPTPSPIPKPTRRPTPSPTSGPHGPRRSQTPPRIVRVATKRVHRAPEIVLQVDQAVVSRLAKEKAWYSVETAGSDGVLGTSDDQPVAISMVVYRAGSRTIKLVIPRNAAAEGNVLLTVVARGIVNPFGQELEGDGLASGVNFVREIDLP